MMTKCDLKRHLAARLPHPTGRRLVLVTGARQVGKTTLAKDVYPGLRYINLDSAEDRAALRSLTAHQWAGVVGAAVLDEAQKEPGLFEKLKFSYDAGALNFSVLLGSAQIMLLQKVRETLAGRVFLYELWPLTLAELAAGGQTPGEPLFAQILRSPQSVGNLFSQLPERLLGSDETQKVDAASHLFEWGGMPALLGLSAQERKDWLRSYHDTYLQRDLTDLARLRDLEPFFRFQRLAALRTACLLSFADLARDAGTSPGTARNYVEYLRLSYQAFLLQPFAGNVSVSLSKAPKLYWADLGVVRHLAQMWGTPSGPLFETMVVAEAVKLIRTLSLDAIPTFYRTRAGFEVDLVVETPEGVLAFESKARAASTPTDFSHLRHLRQSLGESFRAGFVVTQGGTVSQPSGNAPFWSVPFHRLFT